MAVTGRPSIFPGEKSVRIQGVITPLGSKRFEQHRRDLAKLAGEEREHVSDGAVIIYLSLTHEEVTKLLAKREKQSKK